MGPHSRGPAQGLPPQIPSLRTRSPPASALGRAWASPAGQESGAGASPHWCGGQDVGPSRGETLRVPANTSWLARRGCHARVGGMGLKQQAGSSPFPRLPAQGPPISTIYLQASFSNVPSLVPGPAPHRAWASQILLRCGPSFTPSGQSYPSRGSRSTWEASFLGTCSPRQRPSAPAPAL